MTIHKENAIYVTILEIELQIFDMGNDTNFQNHSFVVTNVHKNVQHDDNLNNLLHGTKSANIVDIDKQMSSHSRIQIDTNGLQL